MIDHARQIKKIALGLQDETSRADDRRERMQDIVDLADDLITRHTDGGR